MKPYAARKMMLPSELELLGEVKGLVRSLDHELDSTPEVRCHELAAALVEHLRDRHPVDIAHGYCGAVQHSWLWTRRPTDDEKGLWHTGGGWLHDTRPKILDVYAPGIVPQVLLIDTWALLPWRRRYAWYDTISVHLDVEVVAELRDRFRARDSERLLCKVCGRGLDPHFHWSDAPGHGDHCPRCHKQIFPLGEKANHDRAGTVTQDFHGLLPSGRTSRL